MGTAPLNESENVDSEELPRERLSADRIAHLKAIQRKRFILAALAGVVLLILGFFAGQQAREIRNSDIGVPSAVQLVQSSAPCNGLTSEGDS